MRGHLFLLLVEIMRADLQLRTCNRPIVDSQTTSHILQILNLNFGTMINVVNRRLLDLKYWETFVSPNDCSLLEFEALTDGFDAG